MSSEEEVLQVFYSEAIILRVHTHFFANISCYFFMFSFDHSSKSLSGSTKIILETVEVGGKKVYIHLFENYASEKIAFELIKPIKTIDTSWASIPHFCKLSLWMTPKANQNRIKSGKKKKKQS